MCQDNYEEEFYESPNELFGFGDPHDILCNSYIKDMLEDEDTTNGIRRKLREIVNSVQLQNDLLEKIYEALDDCEALCNYITDFSVEELGKMDGPWNITMNVVNKTIECFLEEQKEII